MRVNKPRVPALPASEWSPKASQIMAPFVADGRDFNVFRTLMNHPDLAKRWLVFANHVLGGNTLPEHDRELLILHIGHLCRADYEWNKHAEISRYLGMSEELIASSQVGPSATGLDAFNRLLLTATDELHADAHISDQTWAALSEHYSVEQMMDLVFTVGQYNLVSMALNSFGVQPDQPRD